jgi:hypothetical protein
VEKLVVTTLLIFSQKPKMTVATVMHQKNEMSPNLKHIYACGGWFFRKEVARERSKTEQPTRNEGAEPRGGLGGVKKKKGYFWERTGLVSWKSWLQIGIHPFCFHFVKFSFVDSGALPDPMTGAPRQDVNHEPRPSRWDRAVT